MWNHWIGSIDAKFRIKIQMSLRCKWFQKKAIIFLEMQNIKVMRKSPKWCKNEREKKQMNQKRSKKLKYATKNYIKCVKIQKSKRMQKASKMTFDLSNNMLKMSNIITETVNFQYPKKRFLPTFKRALKSIFTFNNQPKSFNLVICTTTNPFIEVNENHSLLSEKWMENYGLRNRCR